MSKICNQTFIKDVYRDKKYTGTMKCVACNEESNINLMLPCSVIDLNKQMKAFSKLHAIKGCNKKQLPAPEWACKSIGIII